MRRITVRVLWLGYLLRLNAQKKKRYFMKCNLQVTSWIYLSSSQWPSMFVDHSIIAIAIYLHIFLHTHTHTHTHVCTWKNTHKHRHTNAWIAIKRLEFRRVFQTENRLMVIYVIDKNIYHYNIIFLLKAFSRLDLVWYKVIVEEQPVKSKLTTLAN